MKNEGANRNVLATWFLIIVAVLAAAAIVLFGWSAYQRRERARVLSEETSEEPRHYFKVPIRDMPLNHRTHVEVTGQVKSLGPRPDGDTHIQITDGNDFVVAECIPKLPCAVIPEVGQTVTVRGISRYDREKRWYEVHPVEEIEIRK